MLSSARSGTDRRHCLRGNMPAWKKFAFLFSRWLFAVLFVVTSQPQFFLPVDQLPV